MFCLATFNLGSSSVLNLDIPASELSSKDRLSLEVELELALEVEDQIRASALECDQAQESLTKQIGELR